jgi:L-alanine-DL-glutamate epimerase-like enolase superfamily enzyme
MTPNDRSGLNRRHWLARTAATGAAFKFAEPGAGAQTAQNRAVNRNSAPSQLKITDMRVCTIAGVTGLDYPIIRIDTNQGVYGLGEVRDGGVAGWALILKPHVLGKNPLDIEPLLDNLRKFSNHRRGGGGFSAIDTALHDIVGKVYGVPCYRLLGSKYRDRVRIYCHFPQSQEPRQFAEGVRLRKQQGFTFHKMDDLSAARLLNGVPGAVQSNGVATDKGIKLMCERIAQVREIVGWEAPLAADHFGALDIKESIRLARAFEPYRLAWMEDILQVGTLRAGDAPANWRAYQEIRQATLMPQAIGESLFGLEEGFKDFIDNRAIDIVHPDLLTAGGLRETKRIADYASISGIPTACHYVATPVGCMATVHAIATMKDFLALETMAPSNPWWDDLVTGLPKPIIQNGYIQVPEAPGLGLELNEDVVKQHLAEPGYFLPTPQYDNFIIDDIKRNRRRQP